jgi:hypothetical protein
MTPRFSKAASKPSPLLSVKPDEPNEIIPSGVRPDDNFPRDLSVDAHRPNSLAEEIPPKVSVEESAAERGRRDLFFFCKEILGYKDMLPRVHRNLPPRRLDSAHGNKLPCTTWRPGHAASSMG